VLTFRELLFWYIPNGFPGGDRRLVLLLIGLCSFSAISAVVVKRLVHRREHLLASGFAVSQLALTLAFSMSFYLRNISKEKLPQIGATLFAYELGEVLVVG